MLYLSQEKGKENKTMKHNQKPFDQWTKWDWFVDDVKQAMASPFFWMIGIMILLAVAVVVLVIVATVNGTSAESTHTSFWTWFNLNTTLHNLNLN